MIERAFFLFRGAVYKVGAEAIRGEPVEPSQATSQDQLVLFVFTGKQIDELRNARFYRSARVIVGGDDDFGQREDGPRLLGGEMPQDIWAGLLRLLVRGVRNSLRRGAGHDRQTERSRGRSGHNLERLAARGFRT